ncbi:hypothetical protein DFS34DRAFT_303880 [Phlyctochytrium arcticum]|nr:hypothetical protein DFS34DRAFT_303880 [Phlyctochytrium arcticum]
MKMPGWLEDNFTDLANHQALYSQKHVCTATCVKYAIQNWSADSKPPSCRFRFPRSLHSSTDFNENGDLHIKRSHAFLNRYNQPIAVGLRHNHDWTFLNSTSQCLSTIYYTTNYGTKLHTPMYKRLALASTLLEHIPQNQTPDNTDPLEPQPPSHSTVLHANFSCGGPTKFSRMLRDPRSKYVLTYWGLNWNSPPSLFAKMSTWNRSIIG